MERTEHYRKESIILSQINQKKMGKERRKKNRENEFLVVFQTYVTQRRRNSGESAAHMCTL